MTSQFPWVAVGQGLALSLLSGAIIWGFTLIRELYFGTKPTRAQGVLAVVSFVVSAGLTLFLFGVPLPVLSDIGPELETAISLRQSGQTEGALEALERIVDREPSNAAAMANLCGLQLEAGRLSTAEITCRRAAAIAPNSWLAQYNLACALALSAQEQEALAALARALSAVEQDGRAPLSRDELAKRARTDNMLRALHDRAQFATLTGH